MGQCGLSTNWPSTDELTTIRFVPIPADSGIGGRNSYFVLGDFREPPELNWMPTIPHGRVEEFDFESRILRNHRRITPTFP